MYTSVSTDFKDECKQNVNEYKRIAKIHVVEDNIDITNDDVLVDFTIEEIAHSNGTFVGNSVAKKITLNIINDGSYNLENKEIQVYVGIDYEGDGSDEELVPYGNFIIAKPENEEVKDTSNYVGYDYMMKAEKPYVEGNITYPISLYNYLNSVCTSLNITLGNSSIPNGSYNVLGDAYTNGESYRQVIEDIAKCCGGFAVIGRDNKLYIRTLDVASLENIATEDSILIETEDEIELVSEAPSFASVGDHPSENLTPDEYFDDFSTANKYGPVNKVALALNENVIGEDTIMQDGDSIAENGIIEIRICDIAFLNSEAQRELCISGVYNVLHNLNYTPFSVNYYGYPYIDSGDFIKIRSVKSGREYYSYALNHTFTYNGGFSGKIEAPALTDVEDEYKATTDAKNAYRHTELRVNKIDGEITSIVEEIGDRSEKTTSITQDIDGIQSLVEETIDITDDAEGTDPLTMENAMEGSLLELHIYGNNQVFDYLYPADDLYPSDDLYPMGDSRIRIWTDNLCPDSMDRWINGYTAGSTGRETHDNPYNPAMILSEYIEINDDFYLSLESSDFKIFGVTYYDEDKVFISKVTVKANETAQTIPNDTKYIRFEIVRYNYHYNDTGYVNNYPEILPADIVDAKPMIKYGTEKGEYCGYNNTVIELGVTEVLRRLVKEDGTVLRDSFDLVNNKATVTRIVGVDSSGNLYDMVTPVVTDLGEMTIPITEGKNYFEIVNYNAVCKTRWVIQNGFTKTFASTVDLESKITQLASSINLQVSKKVGNNEIIARINMAVLGVDDAEVPEDVEKSIIQISANKVSIASDYFNLSKTGYITATGGTVGGITLSSNMLYKRYTQGGANYESGLYLPNSMGSSGNACFLYAGRPVGENIFKSNMFIEHNGKIFFRTGSMSMIYEPTINQDGSAQWNNAMNFNADGINRYLPNGNRWTYEGITYSGGVPYGYRLAIYDAQIYTIYDGVHDLVIAGFKRVGNNLEQSRVDFYGPSYVDGALIQTASSDERLKENIEECQTNALDIIDGIDFYSFDWKDETKGHVDIGFIAQRLQEQYEKLVIYSEGTDNKGNPKDTYQIDLLNTLALTMKGVQELSRKVNDLENEIKELKGEE